MLRTRTRNQPAPPAPPPEDASPVPEVSIVIPCLNEAETLGTCIAKAKQALRQHGIDGEIVVADNGSTDESPALAARLGARVVAVAAKGYGNALMGGIAAALLPVAEYPEVTPPMVRVSAVYPGANAQVVADSVAAPIEQQVNGVDRMMYMSSQSSNDGSYTLTVTFEIGTDPNMNQVLVQNRVSLALAQLPTQVQIQGINVKK